MTNLNNLVSSVRTLAISSGITKLEVDAPKLEYFIFQNQPRVAWHSAIPNDFCAFIYSFDDDHCAAYVYVREEEHQFKCTLRISNIDGPHHEALPHIPTSLEDNEIAEQVIASVVAGTERMKARGSIHH